MLPLRWTDRAVSDLAGIAEFISRTSAIYAEGVVARIDYRLQLLRAHPHMGKHAPEAVDLDVRDWSSRTIASSTGCTPTQSSSWPSCTGGSKHRARSSSGRGGPTAALYGSGGSRSVR